MPQAETQGETLTMVYPSIVTVTSGKGGVGKTSLCANLARTLSNISGCVLMDLDLPNMGLTGLFSARYDLFGPSVTELLGSMEVKPAPVQIEPGLYFVPSYLPSDNRLTLPKLSIEDLQRNIRYHAETVRREVGADFVILDCHGGTTDLSIAAVMASDQSFLVTEPDPVTFAGTLALLERLMSVPGFDPQGVSIGYILNRVPSGYNWRDLDRLYNRLLNRPFGAHRVNTKIRTIIPLERSLFDTFGEYPFQVDLAPKSAFAWKLRLLVWEVWPSLRERISTSSLWKKLMNNRFKERTYRNTRSANDQHIDTILASYAAVGFFAAIVFPLLMIGIAKSAIGSIQAEFFTWLPIIFGIPIGIYFLFGMTRSFLYHLAHGAFLWRSAQKWSRKTRLIRMIASMRSMALALLTLLVVTAPLWWFLMVETSDYLFRRDYNVHEEIAEVESRSWDLALGAMGFELNEIAVRGEFPNVGPQSDTLSLELENTDQDRWIVAGCDADCTDLTVNTETEQDQTRLQGETSTLLIRGQNQESTEITLSTANCRAAPCYYVVAIYEEEGTE